MTTAPSAIKIAIQSYLSLLQDQNDNNVKLIVLNKIISLKKNYSKLLQEYMPDILNIIREDSVQSVEINQKVLELVTDLANQRNIKEVGVFLEQEIRKAKKLEETSEKEASKVVSSSSNNEYRYLLIKCVNQITQLFPETIPLMIGPLMESFLMFEKKGSMASLETIIFIREVIEVYPEHRQSILDQLTRLVDDIKNHLVLRVAIWIVGEYSLAQGEIDQAFDSIKRNVGELPIFKEANEDEKKSLPEETQGPKVITKTIILPDGSYGTETIVLDDPSAKNAAGVQADTPLRKALKAADDDFLASCIAISLTKLSVKCKKNLNMKKFNGMSVDSSLIICSLLKGSKKDMTNVQRMQLCLKILTTPSLLKSVSGVQKILADQGKRIF